LRVRVRPCNTQWASGCRSRPPASSSGYCSVRRAAAPSPRPADGCTAGSSSARRPICRPLSQSGPCGDSPGQRPRRVRGSFGRRSSGGRVRDPPMRTRSCRTRKMATRRPWTPVERPVGTTRRGRPVGEEDQSLRLEERGCRTSRRAPEPHVDLMGQGRPHHGIVAGDPWVSTCGRQCLQSAHLLDALLRRGVHPAADRHLTFDVLGEVGGVEGQDVAAAPMLSSKSMTKLW